MGRDSICRRFLTTGDCEENELWQCGGKVTICYFSLTVDDVDVLLDPDDSGHSSTTVEFSSEVEFTIATNATLRLARRQ